VHHPLKLSSEGATAGDVGSTERMKCVGWQAISPAHCRKCGRERVCGAAVGMAPGLRRRLDGHKQTGTPLSVSLGGNRIPILEELNSQYKS